MFAKIYRSVERNQKKERSGIMKLSEKVLKWVEREYGVMTADNVAKDIIEKTIEEFRRRIEELLKEIEKEMKLEWKIAKNTANINEKQSMGSYGYYEGLKRAKDLIKKAFEGVSRE